jgi:hypothetical protein
MNPPKLQPALLGGLAIVSIPLDIIMGPFQARMIQRALENSRDLPPEARAFLEGLEGGTVAGVAWLIRFCFMLFLSALFGLLGGLFGALIFAKDAPPAPPAPAFTPPPLPNPPNDRWVPPS